jgi:hypothetical protein
MIYVVSVSGQEAGKEGRLVIARKVRSETDKQILYSEVCPLDRLPRVWEHIWEKIVDDAMAEMQMKEEK